MNKRWVYLSVLLISPTSLLAADAVDYVRDIQPILKSRCYACHGALRSKGSLRLDTAALLLKGGDSGDGYVPGKAAQSYLVERIAATDDTRMPPEDSGEPLEAHQIALVKAWIDQGAKAPEEATPTDPRQHWSYIPPVRSKIPKSDWAKNPVDEFVAAEHQKHGLMPSREARKHVLLRRIYLDLIGLPPTPVQRQSFLDDQSEDAYEKVVDQLLASPRYGERWGRHWMDVWRYSDWSGYKQEIRNSQRHVWRWRDWIIESLNEDKGYDQMVREMLAGDEIAPTDPDTLRATGYLARSWFKFNRNTWLDGTIEHVSKAFLGVTINCTKCHDHKYDPIEQESYYQLRAFFEPYDVRTDRVPGQADLLKNGVARVIDLKPETPTYVFARGNDLHPDKDHPLSPQVPAALGGKLEIQPIELPLEAWYPGLRPWVLLEESASAERKIVEAAASLKKSQEALTAAKGKLEKLLVAQKANKPPTKGEGDTKADALDSVLDGVDKKAANTEAKKDLKKTAAGVKKPEPPSAALVQRTAAENALAAAQEAVALAEKKQATVTSERLSLLARIAAEQAKYGKADDEEKTKLAAAAGSATQALTVSQTEEQHLVAQHKVAAAKRALKKGDKKTEKALADAQKQLASAEKKWKDAQAALAKPSSKYASLGKTYPKTSTGRRLALARWITDRQNPLAARVAINHIWLRHMGEGLVGNMFDFGLRSKQVRNAPLLDWLAVELMENGWSMKHIHRLIVTSATYRMTSASREAEQSNLEKDRDNHYLWRMNSRRLEAESVRDSILHVAGNLDLKMGGPEIDQNTGQISRRRSVYFRHAYEKQMKFLELFDGASVNECYRRSASVVPQQALAMANSKLFIEQSRLLAAKLWKLATQEKDGEAAFVEFAFQQVLSREPTKEELAECQTFLKEQALRLADPAKLTPFVGGTASSIKPSKDPHMRARENLLHVICNHNDFVTIR